MSRFDLTSVNDVMTKATGRGDKVAILWQDPAGAWQPITSEALYGRVRALADVFTGWGVVKGTASLSSAKIAGSGP